MHKNNQYAKSISSNVKGFNESVYEDLKNNVHPVVPLKPVISIQKNPECKLYYIKLYFFRL